jgi:tetratricopeptide (TPR) repeat protein
MLEMTHRALAELDILRGNAASAIERLTPLVGQEGAFQAAIQSTLAWAYVQSGDLSRAAGLAEGGVQHARDTGELLALVDALRIEGMVRMREGRGKDARRSLEEGLVLARALPAPYVEARILAEIGRSTDALIIFRRLGANRDADRMQRVLAEQE